MHGFAVLEILVQCSVLFLSLKCGKMLFNSYFLFLSFFMRQQIKYLNDTISIKALNISFLHIQ